MGSQYNISTQVLLKMNIFLTNEKFIGRIARQEDLLFLKDAAWLKNAAVIDKILNTHAAWVIYLIFAHYQNPLQLIVRNITRCFSKQKAQATAFYICKEAAKDRRAH